MSNYNLGDPQIVENILAEVKKSGLFDQFRKECIADVDTKPAYQNLRFKVENSVTSFLSKQKWTPETNRLQLREKLRKNLVDSSYLENGIERIVEQVLNPKMELIKTQVEDLLCKQLNIERPKRKSEIDDQKEESLLPTDLEAVSSPESDTKNVDVDLDCSKEEEDFESPAFEPLEAYEVEPEIKKEGSDSRLSGLSGLSSEGKQLKIDEASQLSVVSSGSRLSIVVGSEKDESSSPKPEVFSEEAQMPKFNDNSNSVDCKPATIKQEGGITEEHAFDFKKEEIEFQGTDRKMTLDEKLKEEILESENKRANPVIEEQETISQSSDTKLEIVESQEVTKAESSADVKREDDKSHRSSSKHKNRDRHRRSRSRDRKKDEKDVKKEEKKPSSSRDKHKRHDRRRSRSRDRKHRSRSRSRDRKKDTHKRSSHHKDRRSDRKEPRKEGKLEFDPAAVELYTNPPGFEEPDQPPELKPEIIPVEPKIEQPEMPVLEPLPDQPPQPPVEEIKQEIKEEPKDESENSFKELGTESLSEEEPNFDEPFYGFTEDEIRAHAPHKFAVPGAKKEEPEEPLNKSILEEDSFLGFDIQQEQKYFHKRARKPNARYTSEEYTLDDEPLIVEPARKRRPSSKSSDSTKKVKRDPSDSSHSSKSSVDSLDEKKRK